jgi:diguanylate cyclase (GGDEF)-like protein
MIGRYGGEEFLLVLPDCSVEKALKIVNKMRVAFGQLPFAFDGNKFNCTFSAGIASGLGLEFPDQVIEQADQALYQAKSAGRNKVIIYNNVLSSE